MLGLGNCIIASGWQFHYCSDNSSSFIKGHLSHKKIILQGSSDIDQLGKIFAALGTPKSSQWPDMVYLPDYVEYQYVAAPPLRTLFPMASDDALDLLSKMLTYDPKARISAQQALEHRCKDMTDWKLCSVLLLVYMTNVYVWF